jgi:tetratricopeptide (TPR) repeat protein
LEEADRDQQGRSAFKVMAAYERWLQSAGPEHQRELAVLRLTGLFDRPISRDCLQALRAEPAIPDLTDALVNLKDPQWNVALKRLSDVQLLTLSLEAVDAHPLIRAYFAKQLRDKQTEAFKAAHSRLFDHLCEATPLTPSLANGLADLYSALFHGCQAGRYQEAWDKVYMPRILRGKRVCYATRELGLFGEDLDALAGFFESPWDNPAAGLSEDHQALLFAMVGSRLRALGLLKQAVAPTQKAIDMCERQRNLEWAAHKARHLAELELARGELERARQAAEKAVGLADRSGIPYERYAERATLAAILHHLGSPGSEMFTRAERVFMEAERIVPEANYPHLDGLYTLWGFRYCDFLLDQKKVEEAHERGLWMQRMTDEKHTQKDPENGLGPISAGLERLVLGRVGLHRLESGLKVNEDSVRRDLDHAVEELRRAGRADFVPLGHISRAAFRRLTRDAPGARVDLDSARAVIDRSGMMVHKVDYLLEFTRLELATGARAQAEHSLREATLLIEKIGYGRRQRELEALKGELLKG